jgi:hypothetical protein
MSTTISINHIHFKIEEVIYRRVSCVNLHIFLFGRSRTYILFFGRVVEHIF